MPWATLRPQLLDAWQPGEHFTVLGPTGTGKSTLMFDLADGRAAQRRDRGVVVLGTKPRDPTLTSWAKTHRAPVVASWRDVNYQARKRRRIVIWPDYGRASSTRTRNRPVYVDTVDHIMAEGRWTVVIDEAIYFIEQLGMRPIFDELYHAARSSEVTLLAGSQRPVWIARSQVSMMTWLASFQQTDEDDARRVAEVAGDRREYPMFMALRGHRFIVQRVRSDHIYTSELERKGVRNEQDDTDDAAPGERGDGGGRRGGPRDRG